MVNACFFPHDVRVIIVEVLDPPGDFIAPNLWCRARVSHHPTTCDIELISVRDDKSRALGSNYPMRISCPDMRITLPGILIAMTYTHSPSWMSPHAVRQVSVAAREVVACFSQYRFIARKRNRYFHWNCLPSLDRNLFFYNAFAKIKLNRFPSRDHVKHQNELISKI